MSIWINKTVLAGLFCLGLAGCDDLQSTAGARVAPVLGGAMNVGVPRGYCIDRTAQGGRADSVVVLMGRCTNATAVQPAVITATIGAAGSAGVLRETPAVLAQFFTSPQGRAMISRSGRAADVRISEILHVGNAYLIHLQDRRAGDHWRAITGLKGRLVTITAIGKPPLDPAASRSLVQSTVAAMESANRTN